jgi:hypothetical protein
MVTFVKVAKPLEAVTDPPVTDAVPAALVASGVVLQFESAYRLSVMVAELETKTPAEVVISTTGCWVSATPAVPVLPGSVLKTSCAAEKFPEPMIVGMHETSAKLEERSINAGAIAFRKTYNTESGYRYLTSIVIYFIERESLNLS